MTAKKRLAQMVSEMTEGEAEQAFALVSGARAGATPTDVYGTAWGKVLDGTDPQLLAAMGTASITIPDGIADIE